MRDIQGVIDDKEILILLDEEHKPCWLYVYSLTLGRVLEDHQYPNAVMLSASLRDHLGYRDACVFLCEQEIPLTSTLWHLNHSGYPQMNFAALGSIISDTKEFSHG